MSFAHKGHGFHLEGRLRELFFLVEYPEKIAGKDEVGPFFDFL